jgi:hypothetical protein
MIVQPGDQGLHQDEVILGTENATEIETIEMTVEMVEIIGSLIRDFLIEGTEHEVAVPDEATLAEAMGIAAAEVLFGIATGENLADSLSSMYHYSLVFCIGFGNFRDQVILTAPHSFL